MVNITMLQASAMLAYDLVSVAFKPTPGINVSLQLPSIKITPGTGMPSAQAALSAYPADQLAKTPHAQQTIANASLPASGSANATATAAASPSEDDCRVDPYTPPPVGNQIFAPYDQTTANVFRYRQQQSVNLGSWFVHESWMTPSVFRCAAGARVAELDIARGWGSPARARQVLERHWDAFVTAADFAYLARIGINTVRLPIGYWTLGPAFVQGTAFADVAEVYAESWPRVLRAINEAAKVDIGVLIDLHGAVGSQNGQPHSGVSDGKTGLFDVQANVDKTIEVLVRVVEEVASVNNVVGIQILNEPVFGDWLIPFYTQAIDAIRAKTPNARTMPLYIHDGFGIDKFSEYISNRTDFVVQDHHSYFVFSPSDQSESGTQHTSDVEGAISKTLLSVSEKQRRNLVVDEWSCALTPQSMESDSNATEVRKQFCTDQMRVYENSTAGWSFWSYKTEDCETDPGWCFTAAVGKSLPHTFFTYRNQKTPKEASAVNVTDDISDSLIMPIISTSMVNLIGLDKFKEKPPSPNLAHRFHAIHNRRDTSNSSYSAALNQSTTKGYTDGMTTARVFASYGSRLGFTGQFIMDAIKVAGPDVIATGTEHGYHSGFMMGLKAGEKIARGE